MPIILRLATRDDAPNIAALKRRVWPDENADLVRIAKALSDPAHTVLIAVHGELVVGFAHAFVTHSAQGAMRWEVDLLAVYPDYRGRGLGVRLLQAAHTIPVNTFSYCGLWLEGGIKAAQSCLPNKGWDLLGMVVPADQTGVHTMLEKLGFDIIGLYQW